MAQADKQTDRQTDRQTDGHGDSMTESGQCGRFSKKLVWEGPVDNSPSVNKPHHYVFFLKLKFIFKIPHTGDKASLDQCG